MRGERITVFDMILQIIDGNQLSAEEETEIFGILEQRGRKRESARMSKCLAGVIEAEMQKKVDEGIIKESTKNRYHPIFRRCFQETIIGNMASSDLSEEIIREYIIEAHESFGLNRTEMTLFMGFLQTGLNWMSEKGMLNFEPDKKLYKNYIEAERGRNLIYNPYSVEETEAIMNWVEKHPDDMRGLAVALWLHGDISPEEIVKLKKKDLVDSSGNNSTDSVTVIQTPDADSYLHLTEKRNQIIKAALKLHSDEEQDYIFMAREGRRWKRLNDKSIQLKLYYICEDIGEGVVYRAFHHNDVIVNDK